MGRIDGHLALCDQESNGLEMRKGLAGIREDACATHALFSFASFERRPMHHPQKPPGIMCGTAGERRVWEAGLAADPSVGFCRVFEARILCPSSQLRRPTCSNGRNEMIRGS